MGAPNRTFHDRLHKPEMLASVVASTVAYAVARGVDMEQITAATGLTRTDLLDPDAHLSQHLVPTVWRLLTKAYPGEAIALHMASATPFSYFGTLAYGARYAENLREALQNLVRYRSVLSDQLHIALIESSSEGILQMHHPMDAEDGGCAAEVGLALGLRYMREILGADDILLRVDFTHLPFGPIQVYEEFFGSPVCFQQSHNALVFRQGALDLPTKQPDPDLFRYIQSHLDLVRERLAGSSHSPELSRIRNAMLDTSRYANAHNAERSEYGAEALARQMNMSLRALQRLTQDHGITVRQLLDETRQANAQQFLSDPRLSIEAISCLLGYSEDRAFRRAFKRWTGHTPAEFRRNVG
ncbi:MAG: AraC family transcriptional regulator [Moorea sp. SIO4A3]|nr:AraC family transcriptional regulator [Moorena sp. SIO4A3]